MMGEKKGAGKKGQVTIFIIIAVLIVALGVLIYIFYPRLISKTGKETTNPSAYIQECMEEKIQDTVDILSVQGGSYTVKETNGYFYRDRSENQGKYARYLCYTNEDFAPCVNQEPFLTEHIQLEILNTISPDIERCFDSLVESYENKGYTVNLRKRETKVHIVPNVISTEFNRTLILIKGDESETYEDFKINLESNLYELLEVTKNIIIWEINTGDSLPEAYMYINPSLKVEKHRKENEVKVYVLTDINTKEVFRFAVRSFAAPVGF